MNKNLKTYFLAVGIFFAFYGCQDMLNTNSSLIAMEDEYQITNEAEAKRALSGILNQLTAIADRYVLMGELRGDLMTTTDFAVTDLKAVNLFEVSNENEYSNKKEYYNIINNCNILLQKLDTTLVLQNRKAMLPYYVWTKTLRAWTYFQLGQIYGKVSYFTQPILTMETSLAEYPVKQLDELVNTLIDELNPYASFVSDGSIAGYVSIIPVGIFLGDLYLYKNDYRNAASLYYHEIYNRNYRIYNYANQWTDTNMELASIGHPATYSGEWIAEIPGYTSMQNIHSRMVNLTYNKKPSIIPSENYVRFMSEALYLHAINNGVLEVPGDLRAYIPLKNGLVGDAYTYETIQNKEECLIFKYFRNSTAFNGSDPENELMSGLHINTSISVYRIPHLYLRFAEALNRLEKPTLAFAVLKYGLKYAYVDPESIECKVNPDELGEEFTQFPPMFDGNTAMAARGRGNGIPVDTEFFIIPDLATKQDSVLWVEERILEEMAAETAFEGNRFFDLLRISRHRDNHPEFMAEKVAAKYSDETLKEKLKNINNWFLP